MLLRAIADTRALARPAVPPGAPASVTVLVPARNEAEVIEASVRGAAAGGPARIFVVEDRSTDDTPAVLARLAGELPGLTVVPGVEPAPGDAGKPAALLRLFDEVEATERRAAAAPTEWLLFLDADVVLAPGAIGELVGIAESRGADLLTVLPELVLVGFWEKLLLPPVAALVIAQYPPRQVADPARPVAFANGQLILVRRGLYARIGGHRAVRGEILEDVRLAEHAKRAGARLLVVSGHGLAQTRMYGSLAELFEGWSKNLYLLLGARVTRSLAAALLVLTLGAAPILSVAVRPDALGLAVALAILLVQASVRRLARAPVAYALLAPLGGLFTAGLVLASLYKFRVLGRVAWKGRSYAPGRTSPTSRSSRSTDRRQE